jgi:amino acid transporter
MPRAGGDYTFVSRALHPALGFANNLAFTVLALTAFWGIGGTVYQGMTFGLSAYFDMMGRMTANPSLTALSAQMIAGPLGFALATIFVLIVISLNMTSRHITSLFIKIVFVVSMLNYVPPYVGFLTTSHQQYVTMFNDFTRE